MLCFKLFILKYIVHLFYVDEAMRDSTAGWTSIIRRPTIKSINQLNQIKLNVL